jgi:hypothetical protein
MSLVENDARRKVREFASAGLHELLTALGFTSGERVSINTQLTGGRFMSELHEVRELAGWSPPQDRNVWFGVNPVGRHVRHGRGCEADIARVRVLFADLDVKPGKQFDSIDQCREVVHRLTDWLHVAPVAVIESGHGLQPLWRVASPRGDSNVIDRDRSRDEWKLIYSRWGAVVQKTARDVVPLLGGAQNARCIDNVFDLSRVLRCPGSINWKNPDAPVPVGTRLLGDECSVRPADLLAGMDRDNVAQLATVRPVAARVPTSFGEADEWIHAQPGATLDPAELRAMPRGRILWEYLDPPRLVRILADGEAHGTMRDKVQHAVYAAQEGRAGLVMALNNIADAYSEIMDARARGELVGEVRAATTIADDFQRAVLGAVARARGRGTPVTPRVDESGAVVWNGPDANGEMTAPVAGGSGRRYRPRYDPAYQPRYRPAYQPGRRGWRS